MWRLIAAVLFVTLSVPIALAAAPPGSTFDGDIWIGYGGADRFECSFVGGDLYWYAFENTPLIIYADYDQGSSEFFDSRFNNLTVAFGLEHRMAFAKMLTLKDRYQFLNLQLLGGYYQNQENTGEVVMPKVRYRRSLFGDWLLYGEAGSQVYLASGNHRTEIEIGPELWSPKRDRVYLRIAVDYIRDDKAEEFRYENQQLGASVRWHPTEWLEIQGRALYLSNLMENNEDSRYWAAYGIVTIHPFYMK